MTSEPPFWGKFWGLPKSFQIFLLLRGDLVEMRGFFLVELGWDEFFFDLVFISRYPVDGWE